MKLPMYFDDIRQRINELLRPARKGSGPQMAEGPSMGYVKDVASDHFILEKDGQLWKQPYTIKDGKVLLGKSRTRIVQAYVPAGGKNEPGQRSDQAMAKAMKQRMA
jgi:hypothetical protein